MPIHHLSCATLCPYGAKLLTGEGGMLAKAELCGHVLLVEASDALVLVDTGFGSDDITNPKRLGQPFRAAIRPVLSAAQTALAQIEAMGLDPADVRHVVNTHLDVDHAGGLPDFPAAEVHVFRPEMEAALKPSIREKLRYIRGQFAHGPKWHAHDIDGDEWMGFEAVRAIPGLDPEVLLVPLPGHSRGHSAVAVRDGDGWLLHCGDAYFFHGEMSSPPHCPPGLRIFQTVMAHDGKARRSNQERLRELAARRGDEVRLFCAHDVSELQRLQAEAPR
jgi:glyoxylase-like metal-dependent hydrolase (beta-lactamase superfamily II)